MGTRDIGSASITLDMVNDLRKKGETPWELVSNQPVYRCSVCGEHNAYDSHIRFSGKMKCVFCGAKFVPENKSKEPEW